jgi:peptidoglycan hydrolase-like protein with peptidoglycan-binding domain
VSPALVWPLLAASLVVLVGGSLWMLSRNDATAAETTAKATATALVSRRDLVQRETLDGTLGFADSRPLPASGSRGTLTRLAPEGSVVRRGQPLYEVDGRPVFLLHGDRPAWRVLRQGVSDGSDVRQLERNLVALGHDPGRDVRVDAHFDWATREAVERWEEAHDLTVDGAVGPGEIVFLPAARRVGAHRAAPGSMIQPGAELMETSSTRRVVTIDLDAARQDLVAEGERVRVELPDGSTAAGTIAEVGKVAEAPSSEGEGEVEPTIEVTVTLLGSVENRLDAAPVDVLVANEVRNGVLAAPVSALLALAGGGYALETERNGLRTLVAVETGLYADGYVEVRGAGIEDGTRVAVPR